MMKNFNLDSGVNSTQICRFVACLTLTLFAVGAIAACSGREGADSSTKESVPTPTLKQEANAMIIRQIFNGQSTTATLEDNATARDFLTTLPLTLTLEDFASTEKIAYPSRKLSTQAAPAGIDPKFGDITYYAPWGNMALFYRDFGYSSALIRLGLFDAGVDLQNVRGNLKVTIEAVAR